jgi:ADP-ribose pyrophosphatase YjhB (NUDIX family)
MQNKSRRIAVRGLVFHGNKLLLVKINHSDNTPDWRKDSWSLPGGGVEVTETLLSALNREMIEETGVKPDIGRLLYINQFNKNEINHIEFFFHIKNSEDYFDVDLEKTTHGIVEIMDIGFKNPKSTDKILPIFLSIEDIKNQIDNILEVKFFYDMS